MVRQIQKTQLKLYLYEPRVDRNAKLDILAVWKGNEFQYPKLAAISHNDVSRCFENSCFYCCFRMYLSVRYESLIDSRVHLNMMLWRL